MAGDELANQIDKLLAGHPADLRDIERALLALAIKATPRATVLVDFRNKGAITVGTGPKMGDRVFAIIAHREHVNLQLWDGADLPDPTGIVEGTGAKIRHVKVRSLADLKSSAVRDLVRAQAAIASKRRA